jgi:CRP-like cAMP-binding protein
MPLEEVVELYGTLRDHIKKGSYFGDLALFSNQRRSATIIATKNTDLLVISDDVFKDIKELLQNKKSEIRSFVTASLPNFNEFKSETIV